MELLDIIKSQKVRAFDMYALGPFMMWYAYKSRGMGRWPRRALFISGAMTVVYNFANYQKVAAYLKDHGQDLIKNPLSALAELAPAELPGGDT